MKSLLTETAENRENATSALDAKAKSAGSTQFNHSSEKIAVAGF
jgi:hypothetical protein